MQSPRGMTLIDVIVGTALVLIIFLALFGVLRASLLLSTLIKDEATANAIANSQMEYIRSLPYNSVGTVGGIPAGPIAQNATTTEDGIPFGVRTFIDNYNDPSDTSGNIDYKRIKVTVSYSIGSKLWQETLNSNYAPLGLNSASTGGTLEIAVVNAAGSPVAGATVTVVNASTSPIVNLTSFSNASGLVMLPGAATSTQYAITVTKSGYSTAQTYARTIANQNPTPGYFTIVQGQTTSSTFAIDVLGALTLSTFSPIATSTFSDSFANASKLTTLTNTVASGGALTLAGGTGNYASNGTALSSTTVPSYLVSWGAVNGAMSVPGGSTAVVHVVDGNGVLLPESVLPGNAAGFTSFPINLYNVSTTTYPALALSAALTTSSTSTAPALASWSLSYRAGPIPLPNVAFTATGAKTIGTTGAGASIYKTMVTGNTGSTASMQESLEWDSYSLSIPGYDLVDACGVPLYALSPGAALSESLILGPQTLNSLLVSVTDPSGNPVSGATVTLTQGGSPTTVTSSYCGNAYFGALSAGTNYSVTIAKAGYTSNTQTGVSVSGDTLYAISF